MKTRKTRLIKQRTVDGAIQFIIQEKTIFGWKFAKWMSTESLEIALDCFDKFNQGDEVIATGKRKKA